MQFIEPQIYYDSLPKKRSAVAILFFNSQKEILVLKPSYKKDWTIPGGVVEKNESLKVALLREIKEEIGLDFAGDLKLAVLDYKSTRIDNGIVKSDSLHVLFDGGELDDYNIALIKVDNEEIIEYKFLLPNEALNLLGEPLRKRIEAYLKSGEAVYLEDGEV